MGYIKDGVYHKGNPDLNELSLKPNNTTWKQHDHNRQRKDHARELIQPFTKDGKLSEDFFNAYPEESKGYGFLPDDDRLKNG